LSAPELHQLGREWNDAPGGAEPFVSVPARVAAQAALNPEAVAVAGAGEEITFGALDERSTRLARRLRALGVGPEVRVGLLAERSPELVVGLLGILKAGGAFVPLDPFHPEERLAFVLEDALHTQDVRVVVATPGVSLDLPDLTVVSTQEGEESGHALSALEPASLAYVLYTSGTTGRPKGVLVEHGHLAHTLAAARGFGFAADDRLFAIAPHTFDIFLFELLPPVLAGGSVVLVPLRPTLEVAELVAALPSATRVHAVPALMRQLVDRIRQETPEGVAALREVYVGGDAVPADLLAALRQSFPEAKVTVLYGPTEATIIASFHEATGAETGMVLGRPLPGAVMELRDRAGHLVPLGVPGEVWLGGPGVTRGYLHQPELTAENFVAQAGERFYRTGDLSRRLTDGTVEFLGRVDQQVKVRGFRVEPGEIEAALLQLDGVRQAAVLARREGGTESRLVACVVPDEPGADLASLREGLRQRLPEYMIPAAWVLLEELPLTTHGKIDRRALARIAPEAQGGEGYVAPRTPTGEMLAGIWAGLLGVERVGARDDFFQLGGHSLLATRLVSRVAEAFGVELSLQAVFEAPALGALAGWIDEALRRGAGLELPPIQPAPRGETLPLSFAQERLWFLDRLEPGRTVYNMPFALRLNGSLDVAALERSRGEIVRRHEVLRTAFPEVAGTPAQRISPAGARHLGPLPVVDLRALPVARREREAGRLLAEEERRPFDLAHGPVLRTLLLRLEESTAVLLIDVHHIASDGWSMAILTAELTALLEAFSRGLPSPLPELPVQYADYALWQREHLRDGVLEGELA
ncbi:MAG TPA: amino acid adenylation domain-containing protein, partial [Thermoanaerobaculia bacterium]|nr:amino acid adenylation domain-containing protein [Thermoanaerobaculia bacterium]